MTTDIERQFFKTFNIEKIQVDCEQLLRLDCEDCKTCEYSVYEYPEITSDILLELIVIIFDYYQEVDLSSFDVRDVGTFKNLVLQLLIGLGDTEDFHEGVYEQVQSLFEEG